MNLSFPQEFKQSLYSINDTNFENKALALFKYQADNNAVYAEYLSYLRISPDQVYSLYQIPFLPIEFFKTRKVKTGQIQETAIFESSRTSAQIPSKHYVADTEFYKQISQSIFETHYGPLTNCHFLALLPSYLERKNSSLVYMVEQFIKQSKSSHSGFYLHNRKELITKLVSLKNTTQQVIVIGVTFALLDLAEEFSGTDLSHVIMMETGGMKGRREELLREELHQILQKSFNIKCIHAEYGMTELLSQAYSPGEGIFYTPAWMQILIRDIDDPFTVIENSGKSGGINIVDLANVDSCAFIETKDIGIKTNAQNFKILGRFDNSDIRGCNLMVV